VVVVAVVHLTLVMVLLIVAAMAALVFSFSEYPILLRQSSQVV
jgi:hypothetical protein